MKTFTFKLLILFNLFSIILTACSSTTSVSIVESKINRDTNPMVATRDLANLVDGNNAFALDVYKVLHTQSGNLILSPYSISLALAMTYAGARGETESQMAQVLHFPPQAQGQLHSSFNSLDLALEKDPINLDNTKEPMKLNIANAIWSEQTVPFQRDFLDVIARNYGAGIHLADFLTKAEPARKEINNWVSDKTNDKINDLLPQGSIAPDTRLVLVNAIYFKADWLYPFEANSTGDAAFHLLDATDVTTKFMHEGLQVPYMKGEGYQAVELAYVGNTAAMDILVPDAGNYEAFESAFDRNTLDTTLNGLEPTSMALGLPKFEFTKDFGLSDVLINLGMTDAFDADKADFSGMVGKKDLYISNVIHKAFVAVDEKGTEAAAATAVIMETTSAVMQEVNLQIDRPFIFVIRDTVSGQILFIGRVMNPATK